LGETVKSVLAELARVREAQRQEVDLEQQAESERASEQEIRALRDGLTMSEERLTGLGAVASGGERRTDGKSGRISGVASKDHTGAWEFDAAGCAIEHCALQL
jgi:hypothetical protein